MLFIGYYVTSNFASEELKDLFLGFMILRPITIVVCTIAWALGLGSAFSTNIGSELYLLPGMTFFDSMDYVSNNIMLPLGGMLIALFTGWFLSQDIVARQLQISGGKLIMFKVLVRFVAPIGVGLVFINTFI